MDEHNRFFDKLGAEYDAYIDGLRGRSADEIINASYTKVCYDELVAAFEGVDYTERDYAAFNKQDNLLDSLYSAWLDTDTADFEQLPNLFERFAKQEMGYTLEMREDLTDAEISDRPLSCGDWITPRSDGSLDWFVGKVTAIDDSGGVHVNFLQVEYSEMMSGLLPSALEAIGVDDNSLDNVILAPEALTRITEQDVERIRRDLSDKTDTELDDGAKAETVDGLEQQLIARVEQNYADYQNHMLGFGKRELIEMAAAIHAHSDCWSFLTSYHSFSDEELNFLLRFDNPLEIVADQHKERNIDVDDVSFSLDFIMEPERQKDALEAYPRIAAEKSAAEPALDEQPDETERSATWTDAINGRIECFSTVIAIGDSDYPYFVGEVNAVEEYPGENKPDGVFVEFNSEEYSDERKREIEAHFENKNGYFTPFDELDLYNVLIPSNQLIAVPERDLPVLLDNRNSAEAYCNVILAKTANRDKDLGKGVADKNHAEKPAKPKLPRAADNETKPQSLDAQLNAATAEANERNAARTPQTQHKSKNKEID